MEKIEAACPSCSPLTPVPHIILKGGRDILLQCEECGSVHREKKPKKMLVRVIVSRGEKAIHASAMLSGIIRKGDELVIDDEETGEATLVQVASLEVGDKRKDSAEAEDINTIWARAIDEVVAKIAISRGRITESIEMRVPGEREFVIGDKVRVNNRELKIIRIKIRGGGFKSRKGVAIKAKDIRRIYADSGIREPRRISSAGERVVIKKRESVWSLKSRTTT
ncbi:MAG: HVO_0476 family zinc finger protein [Candidatus Methanoperedens sp.]|nr:HVO_0476 family zinc finger protein [Candidatus Methanoperedens sp.]MCZ7394395.1 HVO_0476 family zinc finger protein [Candidatus Methanoperedens sp.]